MTYKLHFTANRSSVTVLLHCEKYAVNWQCNGESNIESTLNLIKSNRVFPELPSTIKQYNSV